MIKEKQHLIIIIIIMAVTQTYTIIGSNQLQQKTLTMDREKRVLEGYSISVGSIFQNKKFKQWTSGINYGKANKEQKVYFTYYIGKYLNKISVYRPFIGIGAHINVGLKKTKKVTCGPTIKTGCTINLHKTINAIAQIENQFYATPAKSDSLKISIGITIIQTYKPTKKNKKPHIKIINKDIKKLR